MPAWLNGCNTKMQNKNDFTIDFFYLTRHFLFTHSDEIKSRGRDHFTANYSKPAKINLNFPSSGHRVSKPK